MEPHEGRLGRGAGLALPLRIQRARGRLDVRDDALELTGDPFEVRCLLGEDSSIGIHLCHAGYSFSLPVSSPSEWRVFPARWPGSLVVDYQSSSSSSARSWASGDGAVNPVRTAALGAVAHHSHRALPPPPAPTGASPPPAPPAAAPAATPPATPRLDLLADQVRHQRGARRGAAGARVAMPPAPSRRPSWPDPPASGWLDSGLAPISPIWRRLVADPSRPSG